MKVTDQDVAYVAGLAHLELTPTERIRMVRDLNSILDYMDRLKQLDTSNVPPMAQVSDRDGIDRAEQGTARFDYAYRQDIVEGLRPSLPHEEAMRNAPETDGTFFKVPKVIER
jgi:aspartyl-tRNA(Asn)/glutamyl-tRNA(Gln) amidotransferase subunit C